MYNKKRNLRQGGLNMAAFKHMLKFVSVYKVSALRVPEKAGPLINSVLKKVVIFI